MKLYAIISQLLAMTSIASALSIVPNPLKDSMLPPMSFTNTPLSEVATDLEKAYSAKYFGGYPQSINFIIHPSCADVIVNADFASTSISGILGLLDVMHDIDYSIMSNHIVLTQKGEVPMVLRIYDVLPTVFVKGDIGGTDVTSVFSRFGVSFPNRASATYLAETGKLVVQNSSANLEVLERILSVLNIVPYQVETTIEIIKPTDFTLATEVRSNETPELIESFLQTADTLFSSTTVTLSGRASMSIIESVTPKGRTGSLLQSGTITVSPLVSPEGQLISLSINAALDVSIGRRKQKLNYTMDTSLMLYNGARMLLWFSIADANKESAFPLCLVIKTRLIDPAGAVLDHNEYPSIADRILELD